MSRSNYDKPFYVDVGTSLVAVRCASNHDVLMRYDYSLRPHSLDFAKGICDRMNKEAEFGRPPRNCDVGTPEEQDKRREPMASNNETIAEIVSDMRVYAKNSKVNGGEVDVWNWLADYADRIAAAHNRELAAKDDERLTIVAMYENVIADKDEKIAELKARLETVVNRIDKQICHPSESNCKRCGDHRGNCQCGSISNNEMMKLLNLAKGE